MTNLDVSATTTPTMAQLVSEWKQLVDTAWEIGLDKYKPVNRFKTLEDGLRRIEALKSSIRARQASERAVAKEEASAPAEPVAEVAAASAEPVAETVAEVTETAAPTVAQEEETDDMAKRKAKGKGKTKTKRAPRAKGNGESIKAKTELFNSKVAQGNKLGYSWMRHHTSDFGSQEQADKMLKKQAADINAGKRA